MKDPTSNENPLAAKETGCSDSCGHAAPDRQGSPRAESLIQALELAGFTLGWNVIEGLIAVTIAILSGSVALLVFGLDSFVECASAAVMVWRLRQEKNGAADGPRLEVLEQRAQKLVALSLFLLAAFAAGDAGWTLWHRERPHFSFIGAGLLLMSLAVMGWLARAKRRVAVALGSRAQAGDAFQTTACWWLSLTALVGLALNGLLGWWWADPVAALVIVALIVREGIEIWRGEPECC